jgi:hypothetical protein
LPESPGAGHRTGAVAAAGPTTRSDDTVRGIALMGLAYIVISGGDAA